eukprot:Rhum_TRINITY_DN7681_c0_g1::Rhum_TRINITY_DN7681_c0_g1_i1::g.24150::m.24150
MGLELKLASVGLGLLAMAAMISKEEEAKRKKRKQERRERQAAREGRLPTCTECGQHKPAGAAPASALAKRGEGTKATHKTVTLHTSPSPSSTPAEEPLAAAAAQ